MAQDNQKLLNKMSPAARAVMLGDMLHGLITQFNLVLGQLNTKLLTSAGLVIKAGGSAIVKAGSAFVANIAGVLVRKAANTDMSALAGTLATAKRAVWAFYINAAGTISTSAKSADAATHDAALLLLPAVPDGLAMIGFIVVDNATGSNFVGGTTALDTASLTVTYYNTPGSVILASDAANTALATLASR